MSEKKDTDMNSIVLVPSDSETGDSNSFEEGPSYPMNPRKRLRDEDKNDCRNKFCGMDNILLDTLTTISTSISSVVPIQEEIMKSMKNISNRLDDIANSLQCQLKKEPENQVQAIPEVDEEDQQINNGKELPDRTYSKKVPEGNVKKLRTRKSK